MNIQFLPAGCGDAIIIRFKESSGGKRLIVIDFGKEKNKSQDLLISCLEEALNDIGQIDLFILTHMDDDHIGGVVSLFKKEYVNITSKVNEWWLNHSLDIRQTAKGEKISVGQEVDLKEYLLKQNKCPVTPILQGESKMIGEARLEILSPDTASYNKAKGITLKEEKARQMKIGAKISDHSLSFEELNNLPFEIDESPTNGSSIAFLFELGSVKGLFLADSHPNIIEASLINLGFNPANKLTVEFVKISHHGSKKNTSPDLLNMIQCTNWIVSCNGSNGHNLPDKEALVRIIETGTKKSPVNIFFTHDDPKLRNIFSEEEIKNPSTYFNISFSDSILTYPFN